MFNIYIYIPVWITSRDHLDLHKPRVNQVHVSYLLPIQLNSQDQSNNRETAKTTLPCRFCLMNARSLVRKIDELAVFLSVNKIDVAAVSETWFNDDIEEELISIDGYVIIVFTAFINHQMFQSHHSPDKVNISQKIRRSKCVFPESEDPRSI